MSTSDELLFGNDTANSRNDGRDSDGDGVSDAQESLDGTDSHDASSALRHDAPTARPNTYDPRGDLERTSLERDAIIDVAANNPSAMSLEQSLPTGLDGQSLTTSRHYGNAAADQLLGGRVDANSPLNMERNPLGSPKAGPGAQHGAGGLVGGPPPGVALGTRAPNSGLVGTELPEYEEPDDGGGIIDWVKDLFTPEPSFSTQPLKEFVPPKEPAPEHVPKPPQRGPKMGSVDPDAVVGGDGDIERAVLLAGADTDPTRGGGAPHIESAAPPLRARDFVTDPSPENDHTVVDTTVVPVPPGGFYTDGVNPDAGFNVPVQPQPAPQPQGGGSTEGQEARQGQSYSVTADDSSDDEQHGIFSVGENSAANDIQTIADTDSDGDGVSDAQEAVDGTNPNDASDSIRHDRPVNGPTQIDPRVGLGRSTPQPDGPVDIAAMNPSTNSLGQSLPKGLDGQIISTQHHFGNADADKFMGAQRGGVSPLDMQRNPADPGLTQTSPGSGSGTHGGRFDAPPPGVELNFNAGRMDLVSDTDGGTKETPEEKYKRESGWPKHESAEDKVKNRDSNKENLDTEKWKKDHAPKTMSDPDGNSGAGGTVTEADVAHALTVAGADTDFVRGHGHGRQIEDNAPPASERDLVAHHNPDGDTTTFDSSTVVPVPPGGFVTDMVNPDSGFGPVLNSHNGAGGPPPDSGGGDGGGGQGDGRQSASYSATASESAASGREVEDIPPAVDPVAEAMADVPDTAEPPTESFDGLDIDDSVAVPEEADLDDGF